MASRSEIARQDQASEQRRNDAVANIVAHTRTEQGDWPDGDHYSGLAIGVLSALIEALEGEASEIIELRRKGWQTAGKTVIASAEIVKIWCDLLAAWKPPTPPPAPAEITPGPERAQSVGELEQRLVDAFGPQLAPVRHIRTVVEPKSLEPGASVADGPAYGNLCPAIGGSFTHPGGANCPDCHAIYAEQNDGVPYLGPTAHGNPTGPEVLNGKPDRPDGPVTPAVARTIREEIEADIPLIQQSINEDPQYRVGDTVTVGGIEFTKHSDLPFGAGGNILNPDNEQGVSLAYAAPVIVEPPARPAARMRLTAAQVREHGLARQRGLHHRSVSQVIGFADCGTRAALSDLEAPAWWNVGGKAFHKCAEEINRVVATGVSPQTSVADTELHFANAFETEIAETMAANPDHPRDTWRAAKKGSEHYDWWRVEGPVMVQKYVVWLRGMLNEGWQIARTPAAYQQPNGVPVIEHEVTLNVGLQVPNLSVIDLALIDDAGRVLIVDFKAGASAPKDTFQLGVYGWCALGAGIAQNPKQVRGAYYRARTGELTAPWPVLEMHPWNDVVQRYRDQDTVERAGVYMANVTTFCGGCGVRDLCPAQATAPVDNPSDVG